MDFWDGHVPGMESADEPCRSSARHASGEAPPFYIGVDQLVKNNETAARLKDLDDLDYLRGTKDG